MALAHSWLVVRVAVGMKLVLVHSWLVVRAAVGMKQTTTCELLHTSVAVNSDAGQTGAKVTWVPR